MYITVCKTVLSEQQIDSVNGIENKLLLIKILTAVIIIPSIQVPSSVSLVHQEWERRVLVVRSPRLWVESFIGFHWEGDVISLISVGTEEHTLGQCQAVFYKG